MPTVNVQSFAEVALAHLEKISKKNEPVMRRLSSRLVSNVKRGRSLLVFGSGHSALFPLELYHRAGGASFILPLVAEFLLPTAGPPIVRRLERTSGVASSLLARAQPVKGEMLWIASQSGINSAGIDLALEAKERGLFTVAFTSIVHSQAVASRHLSKKRLFEITDEVVDLDGAVGDAAVPIASDLKAGPLSTLGSVFLGHSILVNACACLEKAKVRCTYSSVNTPEGERRNRDLEKKAQERDPLLR